MSTLRVEKQILKTTYTNLVLRVYADETQVDVTNNRSYVRTYICIKCYSGSYSATSGESNVTGASPWSGGISISASAEQTLTDGGFWVSHNADGSATATVGYYFTTTYGTSYSYTEFKLALTTIPRTSNVSVSNSNMTAGSTYTVNTNRKSTAFAHTITYSFGNASGTIGTNVADGVSWTPPTSLLSQIPNSNSGTGTITCATYNGSTQIGTSTCGFALNVPSYSPSAYNLSITETNNDVSAITTNETIQALSTKKVIATATTSYSASISRVMCNGVSMSSIGNNQYQCTLSNMQTGTYTVSVTDSRNKTNSVSMTQTYYNYVKPTISGSASRTSETGSDGSMTVTGTYTQIKSNTITVTIQRDSSAATSQTYTGGTSFTKTISYTDLIYTSEFTWSLTAKDRFNQTATMTCKLGLGKYSLWMGKTTVRTSGDLNVGGNNNISGNLNTNGTAVINGYTTINNGLTVNDINSNGIINSGTYLSNFNLNNLRTGSVAVNGASNAPTSDWIMVESFRADNGTGYQIAHSIWNSGYNHKTWTRNLAGGNWSSWVVEPVVHRVAEGHFDNEAELYANSSYTPHRFKTCTVYDDRFFTKVHDSDNWEYLKCIKGCRYIVIASTSWANSDGWQQVRLSITGNTSGTFDWGYQLGETQTPKYTIAFGFTRTPVIPNNAIIKWVAGAENSIRVYNVDVEIFAIGE